MTSSLDDVKYAHSVEVAWIASIAQVSSTFGMSHVLPMYYLLVSRPADLAATMGAYVVGIVSLAMIDASMTLRGSLQTIQSCLLDLHVSPCMDSCVHLELLQLHVDR